MTENLTQPKKIGVYLSLVLGALIIIANVWYLINDRYTILSSLRETTSWIGQVDKRVTSLETDKKVLNDIQYNLKRLLEKNQIPWMSFDRTY